MEEIPTNSKMFQCSPRESWSEYGLETQNIFFNGVSTKYQAIMKHGEFVTFMTKSYFPLPNGKVKTTVEEIMPIVGADYYKPNQSRYGWHQTGEKGAIYNNNLETQMSLSCLFPETFDITGANDNVKFGFNVMNSEDGTYSLSVSPFVVRNSCDNRMFHLAHESIVGQRVDQKMKQTKDLLSARERIQQARAELQSLELKRRHSKGLDVSYLVDVITNIKTYGERVIQRYKEMYQLKVNQATAELLAKKMPQRVIDDLRWLDINNKNGKVTLTKDVSEWDAFNDITKSLTYGKSAFSATMRNYKDLDRIMVHVK